MPGRGAALLKSIKALEAKSKDAEVLDDISKSIVESCKIQEEKKAKKVGSQGFKIELKANYVALELQDGCCISEYRVRFQPQVDEVLLRHKYLNEHCQLKDSPKLFNGEKLLVPNLPHLEALTSEDGTTMTFELLDSSDFTNPSWIRLFNVLLNRTFKKMDLFPMKGNQVSNQKSFYNPLSKVELLKHKLEIWPGYIASIDKFDGGLYLIFDNSNKIIRNQTVSDVIADILKHRQADWRNEATKALVGKTVITRYNNNTYKIDEIDFSKCPEDTFEKADNSSISFLDFYKERYGLSIQDRKQPMLVHRTKRAAVQEEICIYLVPELCFMMGLSETLKNDFRVMKEIGENTRLQPNQRQANIEKFLVQLKGNPEAVQIWSSWGLQLSTKNLCTSGRVLPPVSLFFGQNYKEIASRGDWGKAATTHHVLKSEKINKWALIYPEKASSSVREFHECLLEQCKNLGLAIKRARTIEINNDKTETYIKSIRDLPDGAQLVVVVMVGPQRADKYSAVKKLCCIESPVASQIILQKTLSNPKRLRSVVQKIALQINCKLGGELWGIKMEHENMVIGMEVGKGFTAIVCTLNSSASQYYSIVVKNESENSIQARGEAIKKALKIYQEANKGSNPKNLTVYRSGQNAVCPIQIGKEADDFIEYLKDENLKVTYITVQKRTIVKLMHVTDWSSGDLKNPPAGTVIDHQVTSAQWQDFYLIPMNQSLGTVSPTHFTIVRDEAGYEPDQIQQMAYHLTHMYYNWTGNVKVPAVSQYCQKLLDLTINHLNKEPSSSLSKTLFYL